VPAVSRSLQQALRRAQARAACTGLFPVIPDIKLRSPKAGDLLGDRDPVALASALAAAGAPALSVVTETAHFGGSLSLLRAVAAAVQIPVLCKDFIRTPSDIAAAAHAGAAAVLLIAAHLPPPLLAELHEEAHDLGLETVVEVHTAEELQRVLSLRLDCLGINNRDITGLELDAGDVRTTETLAADVPPGTTFISESGIHTPADVSCAQRASATAVLVGTAILQAADPVACWRELAACRAATG
jgi:indole-3-glycerol phosphate synthase